MSQKISYLNGVKGFCAIGVTVLHYLIAYGDFGYFGWQSGIEESQKISYYWEHFPFSLIANGNFVLYAFFTLIAFIPAVRFFRGYDEVWVKKQVITRYFRFLPYTVSMTLLSYALYAYGYYYHHALGDILQISWNKAMFAGELSFLGALVSAFLKVFVINDGSYVSPFWCMHIIFLGSYLTYALLFFFGTVSCRFVCYVFFLALSFYVPFYSAFIFGILAADIFVRYGEKAFPRLSMYALAFGLICAVFGELLVYTINMKIFVQNFGVFLIVLSINFSPSLQYFFENPVLLWCGRRSFELILVHFPIMFSVSAWIFMELYAVAGYMIAVLLTFLLAIPINALAMDIFAKMVAPLSRKLSDFVYAFVTK